MSLFTINTTEGEKIGFLIIEGIGLGLTMQILTIAGQNSVPPKDIATLTGFIIVFIASFLN